MHNPPLLFVFSILLISIIIFTSSPAVHSQAALEFDVNKKVFAPGNSLAVFGKGLPNDALTVEIFNPEGRRVLVSQIDLGPEGSFSKIIFVWPSVDTQKFPPGTYSLVMVSSTNPDVRATEALVFQSTPVFTPSAGRELEVDISAPAVVGLDEEAPVVIQVTMEGVPVGGDPRETLKDSFIRFPDTTIVPVNNFTVIDDGVYMVTFRSSDLGLHTLHLKAIQGGLVATAVAGVQVREGPVLSLGSEVSRLNTNLESLRVETVGETKEISQAVAEIGSASGQVTSLLLPIMGMIAIIVALQATILARRK